MAIRSPLAEQAAKFAELHRYLAEGRVLEPALRLAQSGEVWSGPIHDAFLAWLQHGLDLWVRNNLAEGLGLVARGLADRVVLVEQARLALAAGQVGVVGPSAPVALGYAPGPPPAYGHIGGERSRFNPEVMRKLSGLLGATADVAVIEFARRVQVALVPPLVPGGPAGVSALPPDVEEVVGSPNAPGLRNAYLALASELRAAAADIARRVDALRLLEEPLPVATVDLSAFDAVAGAAGAAAAGSADALGGAGTGGDGGGDGGGEVLGPRDPVEVAATQKRARKAARDAGRVLSASVFDGDDYSKLFLVLVKTERFAEDPEFALAFVEEFVPDGLRAWCKMVNSGKVNVQYMMDSLGPLSRMVGTATMEVDRLGCDNRQALLDSGCLDTLVHYGTFDNGFAVAAARLILEDPGRYERADGSDRVYSQRTSDGSLIDGDARYGALRLLANNPEAAREILEAHGPEGRRLIFDALEDDEMVGAAAGAVLEAGLADLDRKRSEDTLELLIKDVAEGDIDLGGPGKQALARILSTQEALERLKKVAVAGNLSKDDPFPTGDEGFNVPVDLFEKCIGKVLDDKVAHEAFLTDLATYSAADLQAQVAALGQAPIGPDYEDVHPLKTDIEDMGRLFQAVGRGVADASGDKADEERNVFLAAGLDLAVTQAVALVPGAVAGKFIVEKALETAGKDRLDKILDKENQERIRNLDADDLERELNRSARNLTIVTLLKDKGVTDQLVPADSPLRKHWDTNGDGWIEVPEPNGRDWQKFTGDLTFERERGSPIGQVLLETSLSTEAFKI